ncbi:MAG TPA: endolytic transglycosylase MltG, partial [Thermodesulfovibrionales bacterium]|nr:endolytic transglycosylase MltG [Thermodesulfovibrionales bacterium]
MKRSVIIIAVAFLFVLIVYTAVELLVPLPFGNKPMEFEIKRGATFRQVVDALAQEDLVRDKWIIFLLGRITGIDRKIKAGYYSLWGTMSPLEIFNAIRLGKIIEYEITVVPGDSLREVGEKFSTLSIIDGEDFMRLCTNREFLDSLDVDAPSLEGYLFPETYRFPKGLEIK